MIRPSLMADSHFDSASQTYSPFTIGDVEPNGSLIHVVDDVTLDILMKELDTVTDFTDYLERKAKFIRSGNLIQAAGEEELLAFYLTHTGADGRHDFVHPTNRPMSPDDRVAFDQGFYAGMLTNPQYIEKKKADQNSYIWDNLIEAFTDHMLAGTTLTPDGTAFEIGRHEVGVRHMALESRLARRVLGKNILKILNNRTKNRNFGCTLPPVDTTDGLAYGFMTLAHPKTKLAGGYEQYRRVRSTMLQTYCFGILKQYPNIRRIIAVATEPIPGPGDPPDTSEDMITVEQPNWTPEMEANLEHDLKNFGILQQGRINPSFQSVTEYPEK